MMPTVGGIVRPLNAGGDVASAISLPTVEMSRIRKISKVPRFFLENKGIPHRIAANHPLKNGGMEARHNYLKLFRNFFSFWVSINRRWKRLNSILGVSNWK
jgi:hypothetical protein